MNCNCTKDLCTQYDVFSLTGRKRWHSSTDVDFLMRNLKSLASPYSTPLIP